jgi:hypothetical protein
MRANSMRYTQIPYPEEQGISGKEEGIPNWDQRI